MGRFSGASPIPPRKEGSRPIMGLFSGTDNCHFLGTLEDERLEHNHGGLVQIMFLSKWLMAVGEPC